MGQHLLVLSLGPVQDFIASARRFRDLWYGSWLLANLAREAAKALKAQGAELIFPAANEAELHHPDFSPANKLLALVTDPQRAANAAQQAAQSFLMQQLEAVFQHVRGLGEGADLDEATARAQVAEWLEMPWASVPLGASYAQSRDQVEAMLAARKNTRDFTAVGWNGGEVGTRPKSSLDGQREAVLRLSPSLTGRPERLARWGLRAGEQLCALGLLKRFGEEQGEAVKVPSTSHMAALGSIARCPDPQRAAEAMESYLQSLENLAGGTLHRARKAAQGLSPLGPLNGAALYPERLSELGLADEHLAKAQGALNEALKRSQMGPPSPYYALLLGDGDRMGQAIAHQQDQKGHQALSQALEAFAKEARRIVADHQGATVYAGGDDVMAMLPLHSAVKAARALADCFKQKLAPFPGKKGPPTLSVGLAVVHHLEPLSEALNTVRAAEAQAKHSGRNALCLAVDKRSGSVSMVAGSWDEHGGLDGQLTWAAKLLRSGELPDGAAYELRQLAHDLGAWSNPAKRDEAATAEAKRILGRKRVEGNQAMASDQRQNLERWMGQGLLGVERTAELLINARVLADVLPQAQALAAEAGA